MCRQAQDCTCPKVQVVQVMEVVPVGEEGIQAGGLRRGNKGLQVCYGHHLHVAEHTHTVMLIVNPY